MKILALDCTHGCCSAAFFDGQEVVFEIVEEMEHGQAERLIPMVQEVLAKAEVSFRDVDAVAVTTGPGSFTGVRVGLAAADGIALAAGLPMIGVSVLDVLAWKVYRKHPDIGKLCLVLETKREDYYAQCFENGNPVTEALALPSEQIKELRGYGFAGNAVERLAEELGTLETVDIPMPAAADIALFACDKTADKEFPAPLYLRDAEVTLCRK